MKRNIDEVARQIVEKHLTKHIVETQGCYQNLIESIAFALSTIRQEAEAAQREKDAVIAESHGAEPGHGFYCPDKCLCKKIAAKIRTTPISGGRE